MLRMSPAPSVYSSADAAAGISARRATRIARMRMRRNNDLTQLCPTLISQTAAAPRPPYEQGGLWHSFTSWPMVLAFWAVPDPAPTGDGGPAPALAVFVAAVIAAAWV